MFLWFFEGNWFAGLCFCCFIDDLGVLDGIVQQLVDYETKLIRHTYQTKSMNMLKLELVYFETQNVLTCIHIFF